jgi:hypothetical protein
VLGGTEYSENQKNLTLKSDRALEFETSVELLVAGDAVLPPPAISIRLYGVLER